jgi:DNA replication protein DnaC
MDERIAKICPARHSCKQHNILCSTGCPLFVELRYQTELSGIPKRHRKYTVDTLPDDTIRLGALQRYASNILDRVKAGQGLYLFGNTGSGKTTVLSAVAMSYIIEASKQSLRSGKRSEQFVLFLNVPDLLNGIKQGFDDPDIAELWGNRLKTAAKVPMLIIDDIGSEKPTEWARERLTQLIGNRYDNEMCTLLSSNLTLPELKEHIDPIGRITSRINGMAIPIEYKGKDRRNIL